MGVFSLGTGGRVQRVLLAAVLAGVWPCAWPAVAPAHNGDLYVPIATLTGGSGGQSTGPIPPSYFDSNTFGTSVAVSSNGRVLAVGAPAVARVYVFVRPKNGIWKDAHQTVALAGYTNNNSIGTSVAVSADGSTIVAGAPSDGAGAAYVYVEPQGGWKYATALPTNMLHAADSSGIYDGFGASVAVSANGSTIVAGAPGWRNDEGAIYLFRRAPDGWAHTKTYPGGKVWADVGEPGDSNGGGIFGESVAMSADGDTIVAGAPFESGGEGGVYVIKRSHVRSGRIHELRDLASGTFDSYWFCSTNNPSPQGNGVGNPLLGETVAVSANGRTIVAGEPCAGTGGQAVVYTEPHGGWLTASSNITAGLTPLAPNARDTQQFGEYAAISGDGKTVIAADPAFTGGYGAFVAWSRKPRRGWAHVNPPVAANFGTVSGQTAIAYGEGGIPAIGDPIAIGSIGGTIFVGGVGQHNEGAVYVFNETTTGKTPTKLTCTPSKVAAGSKSNCTMTVSDPRKGGLIPRGTVRFSDNHSTSGRFSHTTCQLKVEHTKASTSECSVTFTPSTPLDYTITARYVGDVHHSLGKDVAVIRTSRAASSTTVNCAPSSVKVGVQTLCTASETGIGFGAVAITFEVKAGIISGERCAPGRSAETCTASFSATSPGSYTVAAAYPGDAGHKPSSGHTTVTVTP